MRPAAGPLTASQPSGRRSLRTGRLKEESKAKRGSERSKTPSEIREARCGYVFLAEAARWFRKAADQRNAIAQFVLGHMYASGEGVSRDYVQTYKWWSLAAAQGNSEAVRNLGSVAAMMTPAQIEEAKALAAAWKPTTGQ